MEAPENTFSELIGTFTSWFTWRSDPADLSRDFWMPDESCRVCYECDSQFTFVNRKHHCRHCGRIFCGKCTENSVPIARTDPKASLAECVRVRVCNYCFKQWEQQNCASNDNGEEAVDQEFGNSVSGTSFASTKSNSPTSSGTITTGSMSNSTRPYQQNVQNGSDLSSNLSTVMEENADNQVVVFSGPCNDLALDSVVPSKEQGFRCDLEDDEYTEDQSDSEVRHYEQDNDYDKRDSGEFSSVAESGQLHVDGYRIEGESSASSPLHDNFNSLVSHGVSQLDKKEDERLTGDEGEVSSSIYAAQNINVESVDFENNKLIWHPPEPEDEDDEKESFMYEDDDDEGDVSGDWGYLRPSSSFGSGEFRNRDRSGEEQKNTMKNVVYGHFRALVAQLLQVENLPLTGENNEESWLDIITSLSWEAASLLKPDTSRTGGMDPGGYVKVKCLASGRRCESMMVRGVVCKKNVAHRRMTSKIEKPRIMILGGALEYQRVSNHLSSFDTLLQQEMDHLRMAVAKIDAHQPDVLLVENSVSRFAQDCLLKKDISLVLNIKKPLLERIARCTGAEIVPSVDHLSSLKLGFCEKFHVDRFQEEHGSAGQGGKKLMKTLMFFEGCPRPQAFTILLRGANGDELKKVKHVAQYGVFAAYHLGLETCFLADEGASLPELPLKSPIAVALPDKSIERSISMVPGFKFPTGEKTQDSELGEPQRSISVPLPTTPSMINNSSRHRHEAIFPPSFPNAPRSRPPAALNLNPTAALSSSHPETFALKFRDDGLSQNDITKINKETASEEFSFSAANRGLSMQGDHVNDGFRPLEGIGISASSRSSDDVLVTQSGGTVEDTSVPGESKIPADEVGPLKDEFSSEHQSILVSLSSRCVWNGTVCERSHLFRIKYYGSFDKPLGRFLRDNLFDQNFRCGSCDMASEAHVHCYTHRQGTLTISVRKQPELELPGEKEGKIWMWHRCLHCPRANGFPPATRRIVMSDAAWGLSFGKFLELSFSNHAAASRVASCGHSLHRDCLRFYGFGNMVACFRYASIDVHSVFLPPSKLDICHENDEWIRKEADELVKHTELLFSEVHTAFSQISKKLHGIGQVPSGTNTQGLPSEIADLERMLQKEKMEFDEALQRTLNGDLRNGQSVIDILEINRLRRELLFQSFIWDNRLVNVVNNSSESNSRNPMAEKQVQSLTVDEGSVVPDAHSKVKVPLAPHASDSVDEKLTEIQSQIKQYHEDHLENNRCEIPNHTEDSPGKLTSKTDLCDYDYPSESEKIIPRTLSDGQFPRTVDFNLSNTLDAVWTGETDPTSAQEKENNGTEDAVFGSALSRSLEKQFSADQPYGLKTSISSASLLSTKDHDIAEEPVSWLGLSFLSFYRAANKSFLPSAQKLEDLLSEYKPVYVTSFRESDLQGGARLLLPVHDAVIPIYDDEPTSMIAYALASYDYVLQLSDEAERLRETESFSSFSFSDSMQFQSFHSMDDLGSESTKSTTDESTFLSMHTRTSSGLDPLLYSKTLNAKVTFADDGPHGKARYSVTCYYARRFEALRRICCPSETEYIRSLTRCKKWGAQGGKSNVFFAKTLDDRFIIKQVTKTELESFIKFAPAYFKYLSESIDSGSPTCLAKILGIYQVTSKHLKGGREWKMDVLVMENLLYRRNVIQLYDLKGSTRSRYNPDASGTNKVLLDQNLIEAMPTSPIFVGNKAKRLLERAVWNDTSFLASVDVMDYSLLVGIDSEKHELVLGIIDFMRQYTWDKHLETWVKASGLLGGPKNAPPTVISPKQYKKRFRKAMTTYFLMVPDQWSPPNIIQSQSQTDLLQEENAQNPTRSP